MELIWWISWAQGPHAELKLAAFHFVLQVPAVAASGMITANTMVPIWKHWQLLDSLA